MNKRETLLRVESIIADRLPINPASFRLALAMERGLAPPPIKVERVGCRWHLRDGRHRLVAHKLLGLGTIRAKIFERTNGPR